MVEAVVVGRISLFNNKKVRIRAPLFKDATIKDFSGGLNLADNDLTMQSRYSKVLDNWVQGSDGSLQVRWGTKRRYNVSAAVSGTIIELVYFNSHIIVFMTSGQIAKITEAGVVTAIWNDTIAGALVGAPDGWSTGLVTGSIDTTEFKGELIVCNGIDKPLIIHRDITVEYLNDPSTGSNVNTPVGKFCTTVSNYTVIAGIDGDEADIYISAQGTSGVWVGDPAPNDGLVINIGTYVPQNSGAVLAISSFRNYLLVSFEGALVVVELGAYDGTTHKPAVQDNIIEHGVINHRTIVTTKNDEIMADVSGWHAANKNQFGYIDTASLSELIDPGYQSSISLDPDERINCFSVWNRLEQRVMTFVPNGNGTFKVWVMNMKKDSAKKISWSSMSGWDFTSGCTSARGRVFLAKGANVYQYGNDIFADEDYTSDFLDEYDSSWVTATGYVVGDRVLKDGVVYIALVAHTSGTFATDLADDLWEVYTGEAIVFDWELPWTDINSRARKKALKYIQADTQGTATFTIDVFVDNFYEDVQTEEYDPLVSMEFVAGDSGGYGNGDQPYGGGRRLRDERPWGMPAEFKLMKLRIHGSTRKRLKIITITILYNIGTFRR